MKSNETTLSDEQFLRNNAQFRRMPDHLQNLILKSQSASSDFRIFFAAGGEIQPDNNQSLAAYRSEPSRQILVNSKEYNFAYKSPEGNYVSERLFSIMAHEIGHDKDRDARFPPNVSAEEYVRYCSTKEAKAIFNAFPIFADLRETEPGFRPHWNAVGYDPMGVRWPGLYNSWRDGRLDNETVINRIADAVPNFPYTRDDSVGDQFKTWGDYYLHEFYAQQRNKSPSHAHAPESFSSTASTQTDLFDRVFVAMLNKDNAAIRALSAEYFQSPEGQQLLQEGRELGQAYARQADAKALAVGRPLPNGYSIGTLTGKQDPRDWDHADHALYSAIRQQLPREVSDDMAAHVMLQARRSGIREERHLDLVSVRGDTALVAGRNYAGFANVDLSQTPPTMQETVQQSQQFDQQLAFERQQWLAQQQEQARHGPSRSL